MKTRPEIRPFCGPNEESAPVKLGGLVQSIFFLEQEATKLRLQEAVHLLSCARLVVEEHAMRRGFGTSEMTPGQRVS